MLPCSTTGWNNSGDMIYFYELIHINVRFCWSNVFHPKRLALKVMEIAHNLRVWFWTIYFVYVDTSVHESNGHRCWVGRSLVSYLRCPGFESRLGDWLSWFFVFLLSCFLQVSGYHLKLGHGPFLIYHSQLIITFSAYHSTPNIWNIEFFAK